MRRSFFDQSTYKQAPRFVVVTAFLLSTLASQSTLADCPSHWRKLGSRSIKAAKVAASVPLHLAKAAFYVPVVYPFKVIDSLGFEGWMIGDWKAARAAPWRILQNDKWHLLAYSALATLQRTTGLTYNQYQNATEEFEEESDDELRVIVNGFAPEDPAYANAARYIFDHNRKRYRNLILVEANGSKDLLEQLSKITAERGKITHLDYYGHGLPGRIVSHDFTGHYPLREVDDKWIVEQEHGLKDLPKHLAAGAQIRFNSCFAIKGEEGNRFKDQIASGILSEQGGKLFASKVQILPNLVEFAALWNHYDEPPRWLRTYGDWLSAYNGVFTLASGVEMRFFNETKAHPFHLQTWDQLEVRPATGQQKHNRGLISGEFVQKALATSVEFKNSLLKLRGPGKLLSCATDSAWSYGGHSPYSGGDELSLHFEGTPKEIEGLLPRLKRDCSPLIFEYGKPFQLGKTRLTVRYPDDDYSIRSATLREFRAIVAEQERFLQDLQSIYRLRLEKLLQNGHITDYDHRLSSQLLDSLPEKFQSLRDSFDRTSDNYFSAFEYKRFAARRRAESQISKTISDRILALLEETHDNFFVINDSVQIYRSSPTTIEKILNRFPGSSEESTSDSRNRRITLALPLTLQKQFRAEAEAIEANYLNEVTALIEEENEQMRQLEEEGLLTAVEVSTVRKLIESEIRERKPTRPFSSILGLPK